MSRVPLDDYPTRPILARALIERMRDLGYMKFGILLEPCAGSGQLARPFRLHASEVFTNDINKDYPTDFHYDAATSALWRNVPDVNWVITNPPFNQAVPILERSLAHARNGVAFLLRLTFLEPVGLTKDIEGTPRGSLLESYAPWLRYVFVVGSPRPKFKPGPGTDSVTVAWFVWDKGHKWDKSPFQFITKWRQDE